MSGGYTPGPWTSYPCNLERYSRVITAKGAMVQIADVGVKGEVAFTKAVLGDRVTYDRYEETTANARLIVAAPDLLEVLREIVADGMHSDVVPHLHRKALAAIAKATGSAA